MRREEDRTREELLEKYGPHGKGRGRGKGETAAFLFLLAGLAVLIMGIAACAKKQDGGLATALPVPEDTAIMRVTAADAPDPVPTPAETADAGERLGTGHYVQGEGAEWNLILVNAWNPLDPDYEPPAFTALRNGQSADTRCYPDLQRLMDACRAAGNDPLIVSSFRGREKQRELYVGKVNTLIAEGAGREEAERRAAAEIAAPGCSEHQLGLAFDIVERTKQVLEEEQEGTGTQRWLLEHCWEYGFILRFPKDKEAVTGIVYEPWHYRYVGKDAARKIHESGCCLEEYLEAEEQGGPDAGTGTGSPAAGRDELRDKIGNYPIRLMYTHGQEMCQFTLTETDAELIIAGPTWQDEKKGLTWTFGDGILTISGGWDERFRFDDEDKSFTSLADGTSYRSYAME